MDVDATWPKDERDALLGLETGDVLLGRFRRVVAMGHLGDVGLRSIALVRVNELDSSVTASSPSYMHTLARFSRRRLDGQRRPWRELTTISSPRSRYQITIW